MIALLQGIVTAIFGVWGWLARSPVWLAGIVTSLTAFFAKFFGRKLAIYGSYLTIHFAITTAFMALVWPMVQLLGEYAFPDWLRIPASWVVPSNFTYCVTTILSVRFLRYIYDLKMSVQKSIWNQM